MMEQAANSKQQIGRACNLCRLSHTACESTRPCRRCVAIGKAHLCADVEMRKRGRPRKSGANGQSNSKHHSSKGKNSSSSTQPPPSSASAREAEESGTSEWQSAATASTAKRPRIEPADGFKIRMPSLAFDPFDPFQVSAASTTASASSSSLVSVSRSAASNLHSHSERISNISSSFFGLAESSLSTGVPREAFSSSFSYSLHGLASSSSSSSSVTAAAHLSGSSSSSMSFDISSSSSSSSSSSPPSSPYSSPSSSPLSSFESSSQSLLSSLSSTLLRAGSGANAADRKREDVLEGILSLVLEELREVKQHNREMRKQLNKVVKRQNKTEQQLSKITATPSSSSASSSSLSASSIPSAPSSASSSSSNLAAEQTLSLSALSDILNRMPFLLDYTVSPSTFVVNDARKPFYALRVISQYIGEDSSPPIFIFVNNSFAELSGYALNELLGRNVNKVTCVDEQAKREMISKLFQSAPQTISEPFALQVMMRRKDGRVFRCESRHQAFYNELGYIRWCVTVVDSYTELDIRGEDLSLDWTPPIAWAQSASSNRPSSAASTSTPAFSSSPASSSSPSATSSCTTPGSENPHAHFASPPPRSALPNMNSYPTFNQQPQAAAFDTHQAQNHHQQQQHNSSIPSYPPSSSSTAPAPSPLFSGADDRIDLQELLLQLIPPSPSLPSYSMPSTPSGASSLSTSSSSVGASTSSANPISSNQQPPGSGGGDYSWLKELQQAPPAAQPQPQQQNSSWFDTDA